MTREDFWTRIFEIEFRVDRIVTFAVKIADAALEEFDKRDFRPVNVKVLPESSTSGYMALYLNGEFLRRFPEKDGKELQDAIDRVLSRLK